MGKVRVAKVILGFMELLRWGLLLAGVATIVGLLWMWASAHFISFAIVMGIFLAVGLIIGLCFAVSWADKVVEKDEEEENLAQFRMKWGEDKTPRRSEGKYLFDESPRQW